MEENNLNVTSSKKQNSNIGIIIILVLIIIGLTGFIVYQNFIKNDNKEEDNKPVATSTPTPTPSSKPVATPTPEPTATPENKKANTIQEYINEVKSHGYDVKLINSVDEITVRKTKITSEEEMKEYAKLLVDSNLVLGLGIKSKNVSSATKNEILELILLTYVASPDCISQNAISQLADQLYDIKDFENKEYPAYIDGYYCPGGLGGIAGEAIVKEDVSNEGDLYIYKFGIGLIDDDEIKKTIEVRFKKVNDLYKIVYFG